MSYPGVQKSELRQVKGSGTSTTNELDINTTILLPLPHEKTWTFPAALRLASTRPTTSSASSSTSTAATQWVVARISYQISETRSAKLNFGKPEVKNEFSPRMDGVKMDDASQAVLRVSLALLIISEPETRLKRCTGYPGTRVRESFLGTPTQ
eukprot:3254810-Rhodomonas_salina.2